MDAKYAFYWQAFWDLSSCRSEAGMPIPWTAIDRYCERWGVDDPQQFDIFCTIIRTMDSGFFAHREEKARMDKLSGK